MTIYVGSGAGGSGSIQQGLTALTYGTTVTPDSARGSWQTITVTNTTAFTVAAPLNPPDSSHSAELAIEVLNSSGGTMGVITWDTVFKFTGQTWANPASTKKRWTRFEWNGTNWVCVGMATADY